MVRMLGEDVQAMALRNAYAIDMPAPDTLIRRHERIAGIHGLSIESSAPSYPARSPAENSPTPLARFTSATFGTERSTRAIGIAGWLDPGKPPADPRLPGSNS